MRTARIKSGDPKGTREVVDLPPEPLSGLLLTIDGKTAAGESLDATRVGRFRVKRFGEQLQGEDAKFYYDYADIHSGHPTNEGGTNEQSHLAIPIPFSLSSIPSVLDVQSNEEASLVLDFTEGDLDTAFGSNAATYKLTGLISPEIAERYVLRVQESNVQAAGGGRVPGEFNARNLAELYLRDTGDVVSEVQIGVDGDVAQDTLDDKILQDLTNLQNEIESSGLDTRLVHRPSAQTLPRTLNDRISYDLKFSGAGQANFTLFQTRFNNDRIATSRKRVQRVMQAKQQQIQARVSQTNAVPQGAIT
jgi:hypothetical protein